MKPLKVKPNYTKMARYTDEEKRKLFAEGLIKTPSPRPNKKEKQRRKENKYKKWGD